MHGPMASNPKLWNKIPKPDMKMDKEQDGEKRTQGD
jgi:hypothetical protein